jgi:hypothetical protein
MSRRVVGVNWYLISPLGLASYAIRSILEAPGIVGPLARKAGEGAVWSVRWGTRQIWLGKFRENC